MILYVIVKLFLKICRLN